MLTKFIRYSVFLCALCCVIQLNAQHQSFCGVELGVPTEQFRQELMKKGFYATNEDDVLYGSFLGEKCRVHIHTNKGGAVDEIHVRYRYTETFTTKDALIINFHLIRTFCENISSKGWKYYILDNVDIGVQATMIYYMENGYIAVLQDGWRFDKCEIKFTINDSPNGYFDGPHYHFFDVALRHWKQLANYPIWRNVLSSNEGE